MKAAPDPKDIQEFQFKQSNIYQLLDAFASIPTTCSLLAADKKRGLLYAGQNNKIFILKPRENSDPEWKIEFNMPGVVSKLALNCDCSYLAVAQDGPMILIYDAQALTKNLFYSLQLLHEIRVSASNADVLVNDLRWNPAVPGMLCTIASDYTIGSFKIKEKEKETVVLKTLEKFNDGDLNALCAAWSPKGKQIVVGCVNGSIVQLKPDLKIARTIPGPNPSIGEVVSILWISNYQFCAAYANLGTVEINVLIIDAPKGETNAIFTCYEDITFGVTDTEGEGTVPHYYFDHVPEWGLIIAASSNSTEVAVLGSVDKGVTWYPWQLVDSGRAELPLICTTESYPVGLAIDKSPTKKLPWGADSTLPHPVPMLHILATSGQLCSFHMVNLTPNCPPINSPPTEIIATPPQARSSADLETYLIMTGVATSTPRVKQPENVSERSKPIAGGSIFEKFTQGNNFITQSVTEKPKQEQKPEQVNTGLKVEPIREIQPQEIVKPDVKLMPVKETIMQKPVVQKPSPDDDVKDIRAYLEEHNLFEKELHNRLEPQTWECGTEEECRKLVDTSIIIDQFLRELKETTNSLSSDIAYLKALLLQSFAWVEETKSKNAATNDITTRNCGDSNKISDLQKLYYYTQTQLTQAGKILDLEWSNHKSQEMSRMKIPHLEFVYQNLILHNKIIHEEKSKIEHLKKRWKLITRNNSIFGLNRSLSNLSITSSKSSATLTRNTGIIEARCKTIASKTLSFTQEKQVKLREHLSNSTPRIIKPVNPSPIQHRLEATLSSLASPNMTTVNIKNKVEQAISKQTSITKQQNVEKTDQQSPLASLNSIVARIGTSESINTSTQNKMQSEQPGFGITFPPIPGSKPVQTEKISSTPAITTVTQSTKPKQDTITFNQSNISAHTSPNLMKPFSKVDTSSLDTSIQKSEETAAQNSTIQPVWLYTIKTDNNLFGTNSLKDALPSETSSEEIQTTTSNTGMTISVTTAAKTKAASTFNFASSTTTPASIKSTSQSTFVAPETNAQTFSFASKPSNINSPFNLKITSPTTTSQTQDSLSLTTAFTRLQTSNEAPNVSSSNTNIDEKYNYKPSFGTPSFQMLLGQNTSSGNQISIKLVSGVPSKATIATTSSVTIEEIPPTESKTSNLPTNSVQSLPASSTTPSFSNQTNTSNVSIFGGMPNSTPTTTTCTVTTVTPAVQTTTTSSMSLFGNFSTIPTASTTTNTMVTTSGTVSSFDKATINLGTANSTKAGTTSSSTFTFGNIATTSAVSVFDIPTVTMTSQFPNMPVSSADDSFAKKASIFGGNTTSTNTFGTPQVSMFDSNAQKSDSIFGSTSNTGSTSFFGGTTNNVTPGLPSPGPTSVFGVTSTNTSPMGVEQPVLGAQPAFGQAPSFNTNPVFGSPSIFGTPNPPFVGGFGTIAFGVSATPPTFGSPPTLGGNSAPINNNMPELFGNIGGNNTFESLASQLGVPSFSSLAQKSVDAPKSPVFTSGNSFSTWR
ncbi:PREDICTED: nuclear pore complex protein Nup214 [Eufriesea mexicana]|uniref:nuclear pore complex protein Nup214 n=1 Tax=Eufriesea mexicana TaxID=516756 RepID=UPI00083C0DC4|nr:PREDICTED: nuclear pore complex protein Nup214 [Eufriesea mexicana]